MPAPRSPRPSPGATLLPQPFQPGPDSFAGNNWKRQRRFFGSFVAILDFIHALSYVFAAAMAGRRFAAGWACNQQWIAWV